MRRLLIIAIVLCLCCHGGAFAEGTKEEIVYGLLDNVGNPQAVYVVNAWSPAGADIVDYGAYTAVRNMTGMEPIAQVDDKITIKTTADRLYYEGELAVPMLPWLFQIAHTMDGQTVDAGALAGASGAWGITIQIAPNPAFEGAFFSTHALTVTVPMDTTHATNIVAPHATIANVGLSKQVTFTCLPGDSVSLAITANVTDFSLEPIQINAVKLSLNLGFDTKSLGASVQGLSDGLARLSAVMGSQAQPLTDALPGLVTMLSRFDMEDAVIPSFVSPKNTAVDSVQFVLKTEPLALPVVTAPIPVPTAEPGFFQRLQNLFL